MILGTECKKYTKGLLFKPQLELCAGEKIDQRIDAYTYYPKRHKPKANPKCPSCPKFERVPFYKLKAGVRNTEIKYRNSCATTSGGPLWKWMGKTKPKARVLHLCPLSNLKLH